ncbi:beta-lactamase family protein [Nocardia cyriacigeorgica]|uniref:Beta-lactamase family protein n=2 Tax=Nocardia cyriacigeorgica TaxID=135487 RepID=A0A6P1CKM4_9NOCA|nr:serine hydrolase domain-containing protein [Nocardia cyriacigeorgica]MBF6288060.1 beta-lactamase family protein [Nocardia cyriacigeorgica]MBF6426991.1 beta-lactamase family protein [Nocardia cyriacigeorgica]NEW32437.1 beta-lactamase family protein [Nocardia cyriacigeorgica]CCF62445.1 putative Beta-lactamase [Nocardia cyriacigeorgica GUH-2]BDT86034.1 serine hydrolase [Nocardia cyriacigeorgica]
MRALEQISDWPVRHAAAAVVFDDGQTAVAGDTGRVFRLASVTKPLAAYAVLIAIEEGAIELDQPAGPPGSTVRHLLAHTSGLAFDTTDVMAEPGQRRIYSSSGFEVLADFVAEQTGIAFDDYLRDAVFTPLGMTSSVLDGSAGHACRSSVDDLLRFAAELLHPQLISAETHAEATTVQFPGRNGVLPGFGSQRPNDWGLGFEIRDGKSPHWTGSANSPRTYGHFGQSGTFLWVDPEVGLACLALSDENFGDWARAVWPPFSDAVIAEATRRSNSSAK